MNKSLSLAICKVYQNLEFLPLLMWLSWLVLQTKRLRVRFPVRAHAWDAGSGPSWGVCQEAAYHCLSPFLSPSLSVSLESIKGKKLIKKPTGILQNMSMFHKYSKILFHFSQEIIQGSSSFPVRVTLFMDVHLYSFFEACDTKRSRNIHLERLSTFHLHISL